MFYSSTDGQYIQEGQSFVIDGVTYPPQWLNQSTAEQKAAIGLEEVVATNSPANQTYYWVSDILDKATLTYTNTPKDLKQVQETAVAQVNATAYAILLPSDWMVVMATETGVAMDATWKTWRASIRAEALAATTAINAATTVDGVATAAQVNWSPDPNAPKQNG